MITITIGDQTLYRTCNDCFLWTGVLKQAPEWVIEMVADGHAIVQGKTKSITFIVKDGYPIADIGDLVILDGKQIDVIRRVTNGGN